MPHRECIELTCRRLHEGPGPRCPACARVRQQTRDQARGTTTERGYGWAWQQLSALVVQYYRQCRDCGDLGTLGNPLTADHIIPKSQGGTDEWSNLTCRCRECNSRKGTAIPPGHT